MLCKEHKEQVASALASMGSMITHMFEIGIGWCGCKGRVRSKGKSAAMDKEAPNDTGCASNAGDTDNIAMPKLNKDLNLSSSSAQWVLTGYTLCKEHKDQAARALASTASTIIDMFEIAIGWCGQARSEGKSAVTDQEAPNDTGHAFNAGDTESVAMANLVKATGSDVAVIDAMLSIMTAIRYTGGHRLRCRHCIAGRVPRCHGARPSCGTGPGTNHPPRPTGRQEPRSCVGARVAHGHPAGIAAAVPPVARTADTRSLCYFGH